MANSHNDQRRLAPSTIIPPPPRTVPTLLIAKWRAARNSRTGSQYCTDEHIYRLAIKPEDPIVVGRRVKILALSPIAFHKPATPTNLFETYDPHIVGEVVDIWRKDERVWWARVENLCRRNRVVVADIEFTQTLNAEQTEVDEEPRPSKRRRTTRDAEATNEPEDGLEPLAYVKPMLCWKECIGDGCSLDDFDWA